jgi:hypothetical protein
MGVMAVNIGVGGALFAGAGAGAGGGAVLCPLV